MTSPAEFSDHRRDRDCATSRNRRSRSPSSHHDCAQRKPITRTSQKAQARSLEQPSADKVSSDQPSADQPSSMAGSTPFDTQRQQRLWNSAAQLRAAGASDEAVARLREMLNDGGRDGMQPLAPRARRIVQLAVAAVLRDQGDHTTAASFQQAAGIECNDTAFTAEPDQPMTLVGFAADRWFAGETTAAIALARSACLAAEQHGDPDDLAISHGHLGAMLAGIGRMSEAIKALLRSWRFHGLAENSTISTSPVLSRSPESGERIAHQGHTPGQSLVIATMNPTDTSSPGDPVGQGWAVFHLAEIAVTVGRYQAALRLASRARQHFEQGDCAGGIEAALTTMETAGRCLAVQEFDARRN